MLYTAKLESTVLHRLMQQTNLTPDRLENTVELTVGELAQSEREHNSDYQRGDLQTEQHVYITEWVCELFQLPLM